MLFIDHNELKAFTELVYTLIGEKFGRFIDRGLPGQNFNLHLIGLAKKGHVKRILLSLITNSWNELDHTRVQPPSNLDLEDYTIEEKDSENFVYFNRKASLECPQYKHIHDKDQQWFGRICASNGKFILKCFW
ncbi:hypothetical protein GLOIN_2v1477575 [Rhizophagus clarus]|nr:hypothetical protein GLOIN_2v1477575 [Rhizophagus clarus]